MKKIMILIGFLVTILFGCSTEPTNIKEEISLTKEEQAAIDKQEEIVEESNLVKSYFSQMIEAVENNDEEGFLKFQNKSNSLFYKEQERWIEEAIFKKNQGYNFTVHLRKVNLASLEKGTIELSVNMKYQNSDSINKVTYSILKLNDNWKIDDVPFEKIIKGNIAVLYVSDEEQAQIVLNEASDIIELYSKEFKWEPKEITIKLYDSMEQVSATVPWTGLAGWNETGESLKLMVPSMVHNNSFKILAHELSHKMLSDFSNDNLSLYLQEGVASLLQSVVEKDETDKPIINLNNLATAEQQLLENEEFAFLPITDMNKLNYTQSFEISSVGFLLADYLITQQGFEKFFTMVKDMASDPYIDTRSEHKLQILSERTTIILEKFYGNTNQLSVDYENHFNRQ
ncbi:hypothetical protein D0S48_10835 [Psychrobacillus sp. AK 1817]|uniref:hypothetical protein n=1 Tax=Psychrobacillus sp. AK 1817 TaxID=2303505 RepID=UPI001243C47E|nr:hypothetical protein [Psychrobacillus sp. AK 1817]QEY21148.1 hypothetical protein D0S48_10835 [Psychrobacillus sp. AK 1817]